MSNESNSDIFARFVSVIGLLVAIAAIALPYYQNIENNKEKLNIWMRTNNSGTVFLSDNPEQTNVIQLPWLITLSNTSNNKLSIVGFDLNQIEQGGFSKFPGLNGLNGIMMVRMQLFYQYHLTQEKALL